MTNSTLRLKIQKIIAKADSSTHPEEAAAFMAKVHALLQEHGMTLLEIGKLKTDDPVGSTTEQATFFASESCLRDVVFSLAEYYGCSAIIHTRNNHRWATVYGRDAARMTFELMWPYVKRCVKADARRLAKESKSDIFRVPTTYAKQLRYVADALTARLRRIVYARTAVSRSVAETGTGNELVPFDEIQALVDAVDADYVRERKLKTTPEAKAAADAISLALQTEQEKSAPDLKLGYDKV